jgi:ArsR family transcriptional regulator, lead/cadmium/zinc/bismuth-responsive transcriptional repressor
MSEVLKNSTSRPPLPEGTEPSTSELHDDAGCATHEHDEQLAFRADPAALAKAVRLFKALGDEARLRTLEMLVGREACVSALADAMQERVSTMSHRLRLLRAEGLVARRRDGRHIYYTLADQHVVELVSNALDHALEDHEHPSQ